MNNNSPTLRNAPLLLVAFLLLLGLPIGWYATLQYEGDYLILILLFPYSALPIIAEQTVNLKVSLATITIQMSLYGFYLGRAFQNGKLFRIVAIIAFIHVFFIAVIGTSEMNSTYSLPTGERKKSRSPDKFRPGF